MIYVLFHIWFPAYGISPLQFYLLTNLCQRFNQICIFRAHLKPVITIKSLLFPPSFSNSRIPNIEYCSLNLFVLEDPAFSEILCSSGSEMGRRHRALFSQMPGALPGAAREGIRSSTNSNIFYSKLIQKTRLLPEVNTSAVGVELSRIGCTMP